MSLKDRPPVLHPFLMAAFPIVFLFADNLHEAISPGDMVTPLAWSLGGTALFMVIGWAIVRNARAVGLVASAWLLLFFSFGRVAGGLDGTNSSRKGVLLFAWAVLALAGVVTAFLLRTWLTGITKALNLIVAVLVLMNLVPIVLYRPPATPTPALPGSLARAVIAAKSAKLELPDIYYIVPEDYGDERTLRESLGVDARPFLGYLEKEGFSVARESLTNYQNTEQSLSAALNMEYLQTSLGEAAVDNDAVRRSLPGSAVSTFLQALGYRYVHIGHWWPPTRTDPSADINVKPGSLSEFSSILYDTTILPTLVRKLDVEQKILDPRRAKYEHTRQELQDIVQTTKLRGPKFVFAHLGIPHVPFVFDRNGNFVKGNDQETLKGKKYRADQAYFTTRRLQTLIGQLLEGTSRKAIIILQTDEGPDLGGIRGDIREGAFEHSDIRGELLVKYRIMNAFFLPGTGHDGVYPSITPVNTFRLVFDRYFKTGLGLLPDEIWGLKQNPTKFVNLTTLIRGT
jgi:hypothetical protein